MTTLRANVPDILRVGLDEALFDEWDTVKPEEYLNKLFSVKKSQQNYEEFLDYYGVPILGEKTEGTALTPADGGQGYKTRLTYIMYGCYSAITKETRQDDRYGIIEQLPKNMTRAASATLNYYGSRVFTQGFSALPTHQTGGSGQYLFSTIHPLKGTGGTFANRPAVAADLSVTSLWAGVTAFYEFTDHAGLPFMSNPKTLLIPHQEEQTAIELLESEESTDSITHITNAIKKKKLQYLVWPYWLGVSDPDAWYLLGDGKDTGLRYIKRNETETESDNDFYTKDFLYSVLLSFSIGWIHPFNIWGNPGAA